MTRNSNSCRSELRPLTDTQPALSPSVRYRSAGTLLLVSPDSDQLQVLNELGWPERLVILGGDQRALSTKDSEARTICIQGQAHELQGWLGRFQIRASDPNDQVLAGLSPNLSGAFDLVIDCGKTPLLNRGVQPFGYFHVSSAEALGAAMDAARTLIGSFEKPKYFHYDAAICAHHSYGQTGCTRCLEVCGASAIHSGGQHIEVNPYLCQGCGSCTLACPTGALSFVEPDRDTLLQSLRSLSPAQGSNPDRLLVSDGPMQSDLVPESAAQLRVRPLAAFGEELWLAAFSLGFRQVVLHANEALEPKTAELLTTRLTTLGRILQTLGKSEQDLKFSTSASSLSEILARPVDQMAEKTPAPSLASQSKRVLMNDALAASRTATSSSPVELAGEAALGEIIVDQQRCTLCSSCAKICPTGAIDYSERSEPGTALLSFLEASCVQCGICASGCPEEAISLHPRFAPGPERTERRSIASSPMAACPDCDIPFVAEKLLQASLERLRTHSASEVALDQTIRCPRCRAVRLG